MKKIVFKLFFIGLSLLATANKTITSQESETINIIDQISEESNKNKSFFDLSINKTWKTKLKSILQNTKFIVKLITLFGIIYLINNISEIVMIAEKMQCDDNMSNRIYLYNSLKFNSFFKIVAPLVFYAGFAFEDLAFYIVKKIA